MILVVGSGIFGVTAALELRARGLDVTLIDFGPIPNPLAESTDISKAVRMDYGPDEDYCERMERALVKWRASDLFHETGVMYLSRGPMKPGGFEHDSYQVLCERGHRLERLKPAELRARFPAWNAELFVDGYFNPEGGWVESGRVVERLLHEARAQGVKVLENVRGARLLDRALETRSGRLEAERIVLCAGAWTAELVPALAGCFTWSGQPVFHLGGVDPARFGPQRFPTYGADIATTGWYGFPLHPSGVLKIANHGPGRRLSPDVTDRAVPSDERGKLQAFLRSAFPELVDKPIVATRTCIYCDTRDGHLWVARDPEREWLTVATGGSGHAFKFAPLLGGWIADAALGVANRDLERFRWRPEISPAKIEEAARHLG